MNHDRSHFVGRAALLRGLDERQLVPTKHNRHTPAKGVHHFLGRPNWVFLTVCTKGRIPWLTQIAKVSPENGRFQVGGFHHRLRDDDNYSAKWRYVMENPVRKKLVERVENWPYHGRVHEIWW